MVRISQYSNEIENKVPFDFMVGFEFKQHGRLCRILPRDKYNNVVSVSVSTWVDTCEEAEHIYASFDTYSLTYTYIDEPGSTCSSNMIPKGAEGLKIEIAVAAKTDVYSISFNQRILDARKGEPTTRFASINDCIEAIEQEFDRLFGHPWLLVKSGTDIPWEEYKKELLHEYKGE